MQMSILYWVLMLIWLLFGLWRIERVAGQPYPMDLAGRHILTFFLFLLIGWKVFGPPIQ